MSETRERELVEKVARAVYAKNPELYFYERPGGPPGNQFLDWEHCSDFAKGRARDQARAAIEALSASTQVDGLREALEEAREAIGIYGYATVHGRRVRQSWATEALAKIDAALTSS